MMTLIWGLFIATSPAIALLYYLYERDKALGKPFEQKLSTFSLGMVSTIPALVIEAAIDQLFFSQRLSRYSYQDSLSTNYFSIPLADALFMGFIWSALVEESLKLLYFLFFVRKLVKIQNRLELLSHLCLLGLGFAALENIAYVLSASRYHESYAMQLAIGRAFMSLPMHLIAAISMGYCLGVARFARSEYYSRLWIFGAWLSATLIHGVYNSILFIHAPFSYSLALLIVLGTAIFASYLILRLRRSSCSGITPSKSLNWKNPHEITHWLNQSLQVQGVITHAIIQNQELRIVVESEQIPPPLGTEIRALLESVNRTVIQRIRIYGQQLGDAIPHWYAEYSLSAPVLESRSRIDTPSGKRHSGQARKIAWGPLGLGSMALLLVGSMIVLMPWIQEIRINANPQSQLQQAENRVQKHPTDAQAWYQKAKALSRLEREEEALVAYDRSLQLNAGNAESWTGRSFVLRRLGKIEAALQDALKATQLNPELAEGWKDVCGALSNLNQLEKALQACDKAVQLNPKLPEAWSNRALTLWRMGNTQAALFSINRVLELKPMAKYWIFRGDLLSELNRKQESMESYDRALKLDPKLAQAWYEKGSLLYDLGQKQEALAAYDQALKITPNYSLAWNDRGIVLEELGHYEEALAAYDKAIETGNLPLAWNNRGKLLEQLGRDKEALNSYNKALERAPTYQDAFQSRSKLLQRLRQRP